MDTNNKIFYIPYFNGWETPFGLPWGSVFETKEECIKWLNKYALRPAKDYTIKKFKVIPHTGISAVYNSNNECLYTVGDRGY